MICASCRTVNLEGMLFCAKCGRSLTTTSGDEPSNLPRLVWQIGSGTPQTFLLTKPVTTIGRVGGNDIILPEPSVSRQHARIERSGTRCILVDLGSLNGTLVNNERIEQERDLANGDVIRIGHTDIQVFIPENIAAIVRPPSSGSRLTDRETVDEGTALGRSALQRVTDEGPATEFDLPVPTLPASPSADADRTVAGEFDADRTVATDAAAVNLAASQLAPDYSPPGVAFWLVCPDGTRVPVAATVTIGRGEANTIVLSQDRQVSRHHARLTPEGDFLRLEDLGSANGTFLNGQRLQRPETVTAGDEIRIGSTLLRVERAAPPAAVPVGEADDRTQHVVQEVADKTISGAEFEAELRAAGPLVPVPGIVVEPGAEPRLTITTGPQHDQSFVLDREVLILGRAGTDTPFDIAIQDRAVSAPHAKLVRHGATYVLQDLESTNGTFVNFEPLQGPRLLQDGDVIKVGKTLLLFRGAVGALLPPSAAAEMRPVAQSQLITFFSLKGGVGTTTLAVNTALLLRELTQESVLLVDLSVERASVTMQLNCDVRRTLDDLASLPHLDPDALQGIVAQHASGLHILPAPPSPQTAELVTSELMSQVFPILKTRYRWIVIDTAATFSDLNLGTFDQSDLVVVITAPDLVTLKTTQSCLDVFSALQTTGERRLLLLNTPYPKPRLEPADIEKALGERIDLVVPYGEEVLQAIDHGVPLALSARQHPFVLALDGFVRKVAQVKEPPAQTRAARGGFWLKLKALMRR